MAGGNKTCTKCQEEKPIQDFCTNRAAPDGLNYYCRACTQEKWFQFKYGMSLAEYDVLLSAQGGTCAVCQQECFKGRLSVDHDHETGAVRGLLCHHCNVALGHLKESPELLRNAALYLESYPVEGRRTFPRENLRPVVPNAAAMDCRPTINERE